MPSVRTRPASGQPLLPPKGERTLHGGPPRDWCLLTSLRITADAPALQTRLWQAANGATGAPDLSWWQHPAERWQADAVKALTQGGHAAMLAARWVLGAIGSRR